jgi:hypothetical protein
MGFWAAPEQVEISKIRSAAADEVAGRSFSETPRTTVTDIG